MDKDIMKKMEEINTNFKEIYASLYSISANYSKVESDTKLLINRLM